MNILDFQPTIKTRAIVVRSAKDPNVDSVVMIAEIGPHESGPPMHLHPAQYETYQVLEGEAEFILNHKKVIVKQGESIEIPPNTPHTFRNTKSTWLKMQDVHTPALSFEEMMRELHGLVQAGKVKSLSDFKSMVYMSMLWVKHKELQASVEPPFWIMKVIAFFGKLLNFRL